MNHPYKKYEKTKDWQVLLNLIEDLIANNDIELLTPIEYVVGYICKGLTKKKVKNTVGAIKDSYKERLPEIVLKQGCGEFFLGKDIRTLLHLPHTKESFKDSDNWEWDAYEFDNGITVWVEKNIITSLHMESQCWYKGYNLIGMNYKDFLSIIGSKPDAEDVIYIEKTQKKNGENQQVYDFDKEGLQVWVWRGRIDSVTLSDYDRDFV